MNKARLLTLVLIILGIVAGLVLWTSSDSATAQESVDPQSFLPVIIKPSIPQFEEVDLIGYLSIIWGSVDPGEEHEETVPGYLLADDFGEYYNLDMSQASTEKQGGPLAFDRRRVRVSGDLDLETGVVIVESIALVPTGPQIAGHLLPIGHVSGSQRWVTVLCRFNDFAGVTPQPVTYYQDLMDLMDVFWQEVSYNNINLAGSQVVGWVNLPQNRAAYLDHPETHFPGHTLNWDEIALDCATAADATVNYPDFDGINFIFNQPLDGFSWGGSVPLNLDGVMRVYPATWMSPGGWGNQDVMGQEMGHGFGLPHSSGPYTATYDSRWDVMSSGGTCSPADPEFGCLGVHTVSAYKDTLGWIPPARVYNATTDPHQLIFIERLAEPGPDGYLEAQIPIGGSATDFYTIESRKFAGYDDQVPNEAVVLHTVDLTLDDRNAQVVDVDDPPDTNPNDSGAMWLPGELFEDSINDISVLVVEETATGFWVIINPEADLSISKIDYPDPVPAGGTLNYDITVFNHGPSIAFDVEVIDTLPLGVTYQADSDSCTLSPGSGGLGEDQLFCDLGAIEAGDSSTFTIQVTVDADIAAGGAASLTNFAEVSSLIEDPDLSNNEASATTIVNEEADLRVTKECKPDRPVAAGDEAVCTIWVENLGPSTAREVLAVDEHVSDGTFYFGDVTPDPECNETPNPQNGAGTVTCNLGDIDPGDTVVIRVPEWSNDWIDLNDHVTVSSETPDPDPSNNQDEDHVEVRPIADLAISKSAFPDPVVAGSMLTYTLTITNNGPSEAEDVRVEDILPAGVTILTVDTSPAGVCAPGVPGTASEPTVCVFGNLADTDMATVTIVVLVHQDNPGPLHNSAQVFSDNHDPNMIDNFASTTSTVGDSADLSITKTDSPDPVNAGDELTYEVTITNHGPSDATDVALLDTLPPEVTFLGATISNGAGTCVLLVAPPNTVSCDLGTLSSGSFVTVFITVLVDPSTPDGTVLSNSATVSSATGDPVPGNNTAVEQTLVHAEADVEILKNGSVDVTNPAPLVTYDIDVINHGPSDALNVVFVDTLPLTPKKVVYTFDTGNGACAYDETAHMVTCDLGTVEAGESVEILIYVEIRGSVGVISNVVTVTTTTFDPDLENNTARKDLLIHG